MCSARQPSASARAASSWRCSSSRPGCWVGAGSGSGPAQLVAAPSALGKSSPSRPLAWTTPLPPANVVGEQSDDHNFVYVGGGLADLSSHRLHKRLQEELPRSAKVPAQHDCNAHDCLSTSSP